ncbi:arylsulfatase [Tamlana sp. 2201CG12-4]|uniref:sulfatase family protein n=1 Tax=Tamlana sp. 2201CG12-4 TaxID=3112582 RepID=UPI002DBA7A24|nr:arylsulfatase [Tamlana sp. 2201CG12-4]MEC3908806.1 arylsulfatase [Tamlana sp. 2201CG12-4]
MNVKNIKVIIRRSFLFIITLVISTSCSTKNEQKEEEEANSELPNIVVILADDLGFGEIQHLNPTRGKIPTPSLDAIARSGMVFTDAHGTSSVCTPSRYSLMTGRYHWRTRLQKGVLKGGESLIDADKLTLAKMLKKQGYHTAMFGKWHLGIIVNGQHRVVSNMPIGSKVEKGPIDRGGFDEFHGFHHSGSMSTWIDNNEVTENVPPIDMLPRLTEKTVEFIAGRKNNKKPFFLYIPWNSPHSPVVPSVEWQGKSGLNAHADFVMQTDNSYGKVIQALKDNGLYENTLVIVSSDNGTSGPTSKISELNEMGHFPSAHYRGAKFDIWDGGHRVPFFASWPKQINAGSTHKGIVCFTDVMGTLADITNYQLSAQEGVDSQSFMKAFYGGKTNRNDVIHHSVQGYFAYRKDNWKMAAVPGSGGWTAPKTNKEEANKADNPIKNYQLYNMALDESEQKNLAEQYPEKVIEMRKELADIIRKGSSSKGKQGTNDAPVIIEKWGSHAVLINDEFSKELEE